MSEPTKRQMETTVSRDSFQLTIKEERNPRRLDIHCEGRNFRAPNWTEMRRSIFRHYHPKILRVSSMSQQKLINISDLFPTSIKEMVYLAAFNEAAMIRLLQHLPNITFVSIPWASSTSFTPYFLRHPAIQRLRGFKLTPSVHFTDEAILSSTWSLIDVAYDKPIALTKQGLVQLLHQWAESQRKIELFRFFVADYCMDDVVDDLFLQVDWIEQGRFCLYRSDGAMLNIQCRTSEILPFCEFEITPVSQL